MRQLRPTARGSGLTREKAENLLRDYLDGPIEMSVGTLQDRLGDRSLLTMGVMAAIRLMGWDPTFHHGFEHPGLPEHPSPKESLLYEINFYLRTQLDVPCPAITDIKTPDGHSITHDLDGLFRETPSATARELRYESGDLIVTLDRRVVEEIAAVPPRTRLGGGDGRRSDSPRGRAP